MTTTLDKERLLLGLIGGMSLAAFNREVREKQTRHFEAALDPQLLDELYSLPRLEALLGHETHLLPYLDVFDDGQLRRLADMQRKSGKSGLEVVADCFRQGSTIRVRDVDKFDSRLSQLASHVRQQFAARADINVYLTPPRKQGFPPHFDITDVFIVQCLGRKQWRLFPEYANRTELPLPDTCWDPSRYQPSSTVETLTLRPGDVLYLPRGSMHQAFCEERESMHLTISLAPLTYAELLSKAVKLAADSAVELRRRVPWPNDEANADDEALIRQLRAQLAQLAAHVDLQALLRAEQHTLQTEPNLASGGELAAALSTLLERSAAD